MAEGRIQNLILMSALCWTLYVYILCTVRNAIMERNVTMKQIDKTMKEVCVGVDEREEVENELEQL